MSLLQLAQLDTLASGWWLAAAVALGLVEQALRSSTLVWAAVAAALTALGVWLVPELAGAAGFAIFCASFAALSVVGRTMVGFRRGGGRPMAELVGREGTVLAFSFHEGLVSVDGRTVPARLAASNRTPPVGARVRVVAADGIVVWVRQIPPGPDTGG